MIERSTFLVDLKKAWYGDSCPIWPVVLLVVYC
jgi:hypothetical protein